KTLNGATVANDKRYYVVVLGGGFHGLLVSTTTRIPGLVSIVDIAPTALGRVRGTLTSTPSSHAIAHLKSLNAQIHANNRLKLAALIVLACFAALLAAVRPLAVLIAVTVGGGLALARLCRTDVGLLLLFLSVVLVHMYLMAVRPGWVALTPLGPTQNSRFWGIGNQLETLLLAPLLGGAAIAARRFGVIGFAAFGVLGLFMMTDNRFGSDGGGAIVLGIALAFLGARMLRIGVRGFVTLLLAGALVVLKVVSSNLSTAGPDHLRSAFAHGVGSLWAVAKNRVPLSYAPAIHNWPVVLPLALWFLVSFAIALYAARRRPPRDFVLALGLAMATSLAVNDSAMYELTGGIVVLSALVRFAPAPAVPVTVRSLVRAVLPSARTPVAVRTRR